MKENKKMIRLKPVTKDEAKGDLNTLYQDIEKKMGKVPNIFQNMGNSPTTLKAFLSLNDAAGQTSINPKLREQIALTVAQANQCNYCLSAHTAIGKSIGLPDQDLLLARKGEAKDPKTQSILKFTQNVVKNRAQISDQDLKTLKAAGVTDSEIVEIILVIIVNMFTNYFNLVTDPKVDFPMAPELN
jgi:uncharacterized peroxidase-related enzyme